MGWKERRQIHPIVLKERSCNKLLYPWDTIISEVLLLLVQAKPFCEREAGISAFHSTEDRFLL